MTEAAWEIPWDDVEDEWLERGFDTVPIQDARPTVPQVRERLGLPTTEQAICDRALARAQRPRRTYYEPEELNRVQQQLDAIYGERSVKLSRKARSQNRDAKGRFVKGFREAGEAARRAGREYKRLANQWNLHWNQPYTVATTTTGWTYPVATPNWNWTATTTGNTYIPVNATYTTGGTVAATHPQVWHRWRDERMQITFEEDTGGYVRAYTDEAYYRVHNQDVYDRWHVIAENDRLTAEEMEAREARRAEVIAQQEAARVRQQEEYQRQAEERSRRELAQAQKREGAQQRALELLKMILTPEEKLIWENTGNIAVRGSDGGLYEIDTGYGGVHGNVFEVDGHGCRLASLCAAPNMIDVDPELGRMSLPLADGWVGQYLTLKHNEREFTSHANYGSRRECRHPGIPVLGHGQVAA